MNNYLFLLYTELSKSKYLLVYESIISRAILRATSRASAKLLVGYVEAHHIIPKSFKLGGEKDKTNLAYLTAREHFICHKLLIHATKNTKYHYSSVAACAKFTQQSNKQQRLILSSHDYEFVRKCCSIAQSNRIVSEETKQKMSNSKKGKKLIDSHKNNISLSGMGRIVSEETREKLRGRKMSEAHRQLLIELSKNRIITDEQRLKMSASHIGKTQTQETKRKLAKIRTGWKYLEESKKKMSDAAKKKWNEMKKGIRPMSKGRKGMKLTKEQRQKISSSLSGKKFESILCFVCNKLFRGKSALKRHTLKKHPLMEL